MDQSLEGVIPFSLLPLLLLSTPSRLRINNYQKKKQKRSEIPRLQLPFNGIATEIISLRYILLLTVRSHRAYTTKHIYAESPPKITDIYAYMCILAKLVCRTYAWMKCVIIIIAQKYYDKLGGIGQQAFCARAK